jgi:hypothetical protein
MLSPLAYALATRLDKVAPAPDTAPAPGDYNGVHVALCIIHPDGRSETFSVTVDVTAGAPHDAAPTAGALTLSGVARMLDAITHGAGAVAPHVRARAIRALVDDTAPADAGTVAEIEAVRAAARAALPRVKRAGALRFRRVAHTPA